MEFNHYILC